jgi:hypothetical protein
MVATTSCRLSDLAIRADKRVDIITPANREKVTLPFDVKWTVKEFKVTGPDGSDSNDQGYFLVLLDLSPMPPGADINYFARDDNSCHPSQGCPDATYLADRDIYLTQNQSFRVESLADTRPPDRKSADDDHEITIVLLNGKNQRIGESAFRVKVLIDRGDA